jgi:hypothetical protein
MMKEELSWRTKELLPGLPFFSQYPNFHTSRGGFKSKSNLSSTTAAAPTTRSINAASLIPSSLYRTLTLTPGTLSTTTYVQAPSSSRRGFCVKGAVTMTGPSDSSNVVDTGHVMASTSPNQYFSSPTSLGLVLKTKCPRCYSSRNIWRYESGESTYRCVGCDTDFD